MASPDYAVCPETSDGVHMPRIAEMQDPDNLQEGYVTLECSKCYQTTGYRLEILDDIDWG